MKNLYILLASFVLIGCRDFTIVEAPITDSNGIECVEGEWEADSKTSKRKVVLNLYAPDEIKSCEEETNGTLTYTDENSQIHQFNLVSIHNNQRETQFIWNEPGVVLLADMKDVSRITAYFQFNGYVYDIVLRRTK